MPDINMDFLGSLKYTYDEVKYCTDGMRRADSRMTFYG